MKYVVQEEMTLHQALERLSPESSKTARRLWLKEGRVFVDGRQVSRGDLKLEAGQAVELKKRKVEEGEHLAVLFKDRYLAAIYKPPGLLSVSSASERERTAHRALKELFKSPRVYVVHRLDRETSGVMLFARTEWARDALKKLFEEHRLTRRYLAVVEGGPKQSEGEWRSYLYEDAQYVVRETEERGRGKLAVTRYRVLKRVPGYTFLECTLETGKKNQIRVHCQAAGCPVAGDKKYGASTDPFGRLALHAELLVIEHPATKKRMRFESPPPSLFDAL